ncbi:MAG: hypothetical protein H6703_11845 [Myxococcales bacterium]|nr:hypothetical protein [Myxococcales bacterium]
MTRLCALALLGAAALAGCGDDIVTPLDPAHDAAPDATPDAAADAAADATPDAAPDATADAEAPDAGPGCTLPPPAPIAHALGEWTVTTDAARREWTVARPPDGAVVLRSPPACVDGAPRPALRVARGAPAIESAFGNFRVQLDGPRSRLDWRPIITAPTVEATADDLTLRHPDGVALRFARDGDDLRVELLAPDADAGALAWRCGPDTGFFGLGTQVTGLDLRGRRYPLFTQEQGIGKPADGHPYPLANYPEAAYAPMGVWHDSDGLSAILTHDAYSDLDLCAQDPERVELRSYAALPGFVLVAGATPRDRVRALARRVGHPPPVPDWVFAPWNDAVGGPARLAEVADILRREGIPSSAIWTEDWIGGEQGPTGFRLSYAWEWDATLYPDLPEDIARLHDRGFSFLAYFNPFVPAPTRMFAEGTAGGWLVEDADGEVITFLDPAFRNAALVDLADPAARDWLRGYQLTAAAELGIDGWMADFAEWLPVEARMDDGESGWRWHNRYPIEWQRANVEAMREAHPDGSPEAGDWTFFVRSGWASTNGGTGGVAPTLWAGDQNTDWGRDDGLPTVIPIGVHAGLAGVAVYGSDIAGYTSETVPNTTKELFFRWAALGAFHPLMRTHHGSDECGNWSFDRDADTLAHYRRHAILHTLLHPYLRDAMDEAMRDGIPITRHPWLVEPDHPGLWRDGRDLYFLGGALLVAPVVEQGATARVVHLPGDGWWPLFADAPLPGGEAGPGGTVMHDVAAPPTEIPVFVRPGTALPLLPRPVDSFRATAGDGVSTLAELGGARRLALYPRAGAVDTTLGDTRITAAGLAARPDWTTAALDGAPLPACADEAAVSCADAAGVTLRAVGDATVTVGGATITIAGEGTRRDWHLAWAGEAFGAWRAPTPLGELDPDVPPPCEP